MPQANRWVRLQQWLHQTAPLWRLTKALGQSFHLFVHACQRSGKRCRIFARTFRHIRTAAAFAADRFGDFAHQFAGLHLLVRSLLTVETIETLESFTDAITITALPHLLRSVSAMVRSCLESKPSTCSASTVMPFIVAALADFGPVAEQLSFQLLDLPFENLLLFKNFFHLIEQTPRH